MKMGYEGSLTAAACADMLIRSSMPTLPTAAAFTLYDTGGGGTKMRALRGGISRFLRLQR